LVVKRFNQNNLKRLKVSKLQAKGLIKTSTVRGVVQSGILWTRGEWVLQMQTSALFGAKHLGFFEI